jgi:hypothetical protein
LVARNQARLFIGVEGKRSAPIKFHLIELIAGRQIPDWE